jgi:SAM-dependent methyltransferase
MAQEAKLSIISPKRARRLQTEWEGFFPYYAGYSESFAETALKSVGLPEGSLVLDPWNGSGTSIYAARQIGLRGVGLDINPVMVIVSRARLLSPTEADSLEPLGREIAKSSQFKRKIDSNDPLLAWLEKGPASVIRSIERAIHSHLVGGLAGEPVDALRNLSQIAAANYVSLFSVCRKLVRRFNSSNPTWLRKPRGNERRVRAKSKNIEAQFINELRSMAMALGQKSGGAARDSILTEVYCADSASKVVPPKSVDLVLSSPPYCTRIDYTAATRIELAVINSLIGADVGELSRSMLGSIRVPSRAIALDPTWGPKCLSFLQNMKEHGSKASAGYYLRTHLDYFDKLARSVDQISSALKSGGKAIFAVQDSYYKEIHNDLPSIFTEIASERDLTLKRRDNFYIHRSMAGINPYSSIYNRKPGAVEAVLCFERD